MISFAISKKSEYTLPVSKEIGFGSPDTWRKFSRAYQIARGFFVTQHGSSFGGLCGALARVRRSQVRSSNPHSLPPSFGSEAAGFRTYLGPTMPSVDFILSLFVYNPETGLIYSRFGREIGYLDKDGYLIVTLQKKPRIFFKAHRLAWLATHGEFPTTHVDHINGDRSDNRIANLRAVSSRVNAENRRTPNSDSISGFLGVSFAKETGRWAAQIQVNGKNKNLGRRFDTPELAHAAYIKAKRELHEGCTI